MPLTTKDAILALADLGGPIEFYVQEWDLGTPEQDGTVFLRRPTANDRDAWEIYCELNKGKPKTIWRARMAAMLLCDKDGQLLFTTDEAVKLGEKSAGALHRIWTKGLELLAVSDTEVKEIEGN